MNPLFRIDFSISDSLKIVRKSVLIYETIILGLCEAVNELQIKYQKTMEYKLSRLLKGKEK